MPPTTFFFWGTKNNHWHSLLFFFATLRLLHGVLSSGDFCPTLWGIWWAAERWMTRGAKKRGFQSEERCGLTGWHWLKGVVKEKLTLLAEKLPIWLVYFRWLKSLTSTNLMTLPNKPWEFENDQWENHFQLPCWTSGVNAFYREAS